MATQASLSLVISHWYQLLEGVQGSPKDFYGTVNKAIEERQIPQAKTSVVQWPEGGVGSARREYLRVRRKEHIFDICGAPFGPSFFVSWWLWIPPGCAGVLLAIPWVGIFAERLVRPNTYYKVDTALMFQSAVHAAVLEAVDGMTTAKGRRGLSELERKPVMREFLAR